MSPHGKTVDPEPSGDGQTRRGFLGRSLGLGVAAALTASYGTFAAFALRFLYPARPQDKDWTYLAQVNDFPKGGTMSWQTPAGAKVALARLGDAPVAESFVALSSTCPHLGCQVHWEDQNNRFFCPCHNGVFDPTGKGIDGPPKGKNLARYPLKVEHGLLYILIPTESLPGPESDAALMARGCGCGGNCGCKSERC